MFPRPRCCWTLITSNRTNESTTSLGTLGIQSNIDDDVPMPHVGPEDWIERGDEDEDRNDDAMHTVHPMADRYWYVFMII